MIDYEEEFNMSYWRATQSIVDGVPFVDSFKNRLVASSEEIQAIFSHSNGEALRRGLVLALVHLASYYSDYEPDRTLEDIAHRRYLQRTRPRDRKRTEHRRSRSDRAVGWAEMIYGGVDV